MNNVVVIKAYKELIVNKKNFVTLWNRSNDFQPTFVRFLIARFTTDVLEEVRTYEALVNISCSERS